MKKTILTLGVILTLANAAFGADKAAAGSNLTSSTVAPAINPLYMTEWSISWHTLKNPTVEMANAVCPKGQTMHYVNKKANVSAVHVISRHGGDGWVYCVDRDGRPSTVSFQIAN